MPTFVVHHYQLTVWTKQRPNLIWLKYPDTQPCKSFRPPYQHIQTQRTYAFHKYYGLIIKGNNWNFNQTCNKCRNRWWMLKKSISIVQTAYISMLFECDSTSTGITFNTTSNWGYQQCFLRQEIQAIKGKNYLFVDKTDEAIAFRFMSLWVAYDFAITVTMYNIDTTSHIWINLMLQ